jgi:hypothetical protein
MKFNSQICTTKIQSERLLALGLKKETADIVIRPDNTLIIIRENSYIYNNLENAIQAEYCPAWSLHRLLCLYGQDYEIKELYNNAEECYGMLITAIEIAIENGDFNQEYLDR